MMAINSPQQVAIIPFKDVEIGTNKLADLGFTLGSIGF